MPPAPPSTGIFEDLVSRLHALEAAVAHLAEQVRAHGLTSRNPTGDPSVDIWADGALGITEATEFSGLGTTTLYELMNSGELPFSQPTRHRLVPRRWLVEHLAESANHPVTAEKA